jgi:hypothetical protein
VGLHSTGRGYGLPRSGFVKSVFSFNRKDCSLPRRLSAARWVRREHYVADRV